MRITEGDEMQVCCQEGGPYAINVGAPVGRLRVIGPGTRTIWDGPLRIDLGLLDVQPDPDRPLASRSVVHAALDSEDDYVTLDATKDADEVD